MSFARELSSRVRKHLSDLKRMYDQRVELAEARARRQLAEARTKTEREKARLQLVRERMVAKKELYEAQTATRQAKLALERARKEAGDLTLGEQLSIFGQQFGWKPKRKPVRRKTTSKGTRTRRASPRRLRS